MKARLRASLPTLSETAFGGPLWGLLMAASCAMSLYAHDRLDSGNDLKLLLLFFIGGTAGWLLMLPLARFFAHRRGAETRFAAFLFWLTACTLAITSGLFALQYRSFYVQWHAPFLTRDWTMQLIFTSASAVYQFSVFGLRLYLPFGFLCLFAASAIMARRIR